MGNIIDKLDEFKELAGNVESGYFERKSNEEFLADLNPSDIIKGIAVVKAFVDSKISAELFRRFNEDTKGGLPEALLSGLYLDIQCREHGQQDGQGHITGQLTQQDITICIEGIGHFAYGSYNEFRDNTETLSKAVRGQTVTPTRLITFLKELQAGALTPDEIKSAAYDIWQPGDFQKDLRKKIVHGWIEENPYFTGKINSQPAEIRFIGRRAICVCNASIVMNYQDDLIHCLETASGMKYHDDQRQTRRYVDPAAADPANAEDISDIIQNTILYSNMPKKLEGPVKKTVYRIKQNKSHPKRLSALLKGKVHPQAYGNDSLFMDVHYDRRKSSLAYVTLVARLRNCGSIHLNMPNTYEKIKHIKQIFFPSR